MKCHGHKPNASPGIIEKDKNKQIEEKWREELLIENDSNICWWMLRSREWREKTNGKRQGGRQEDRTLRDQPWKSRLCLCLSSFHVFFNKTSSPLEKRQASESDITDEESKLETLYVLKFDSKLVCLLPREPPLYIRLLIPPGPNPNSYKPEAKCHDLDVVGETGVKVRWHRTLLTVSLQAICLMRSKMAVYWSKWIMIRCYVVNCWEVWGLHRNGQLWIWGIVPAVKGLFNIYYDTWSRRIKRKK